MKKYIILLLSLATMHIYTMNKNTNLLSEKLSLSGKWLISESTDDTLGLWDGATRPIPKLN